MAERYLKATGDWSNVNTWSDADGGAPGASAPTSADNVHITLNGNGLTLNVDGASACLDFLGTVNNTAILSGAAALVVYGNFVKAAAMTWTYSGLLSFAPPAANVTATFNGALNGPVAVGINSGLTPSKLTFQDTLNIGANSLTFGRHRIYTNGQTITCGAFSSATGSTKEINLGASVINCTAWSITITSLTWNQGTSTINCSGAFVGNALDYNILNLSGATASLSGTKAIATLYLDPTKTMTITVTDGSNLTITTPTLSGSSGHVHTFVGTGAGGYTLTKAGGGVVNLDFVTVSYCTGGPASTWVAWAHSNNGGNNTGWTFTGNIKGNSLLEDLIATGIL